MKAELDLDIDELSLKPTDSVMDKTDLVKLGVQPEEVDSLMIASVEGILGEVETAELSSYVASKGLQKDLKYYQSTILKPDLEEGYGNNRGLKKKRRLAPFIYGSVGVSIISIALWGLLTNKPVQESSPVTAIQTIQESTLALSPKLNTQSLDGKAFYLADEVAAGGHELSHSARVNNESESLNGLTSSGVTSSQPLVEDIEHVNVKPNQIITNDMNEDLDKQSDEILDPIKAQENILDKKTRDQQKKIDAGLITEEPIKVITDIAEGIFNKDISYKRDRNTQSDQLVSHHVKLGKFEFQRKKH
jgi:hypothetical protein